MKTSTFELQNIMMDFYKQHQRLPNAIIFPAAERMEGRKEQVEKVLCIKVVFAAVDYPTAAIL